MSADISRIRSNPLLDFAGVELKQGGVLLDADFNELVAVVDRRLRAAASDILGRSTVSAMTPNAFKLSLAGGALSIGKGRLYVDGLLAENHGAVTVDAAKKTFDPLLGEPAFADPVDYALQPYLPDTPALPESGRHLVYLDVWQRALTYLERSELVEPAVGVETSSRLQTVWQVRVLEDDAGSADCTTPDDDVAGWTALIEASSGRLTTGSFEVPPEDDPCELPPSGGYRGLENQAYRVEIHDAGLADDGATFKWSRENASVGSAVSSVVSANELEVQTLGRDDVLRMKTGDWVEIMDDARELSQRGGEMRQITVIEAARRISFVTALPAEMLPPAFPDTDFPRERNLRVKRWDQKQKVLSVQADGTTPVIQDLDASGSGGVIDVPAAGTTLLLENGVTVSFTASGSRGFRSGDFWVFAARTADASVEALTDAPPRGIHHHYARLGIWDVAAGTVTDCRTPWPPGGEAHDCGCTQCVTPESHASGHLTIQAAVDRLRDTGGTVCLGAGQYPLQEAVRLEGTRAVRIRGQGAATVVVTPGRAFSVNRCIALAIEDLAILSLGRTSAVSVQTALGISLQRLVIALIGGDDARGAAIALAGAVVGATIRDNAIFAGVAIQGLDPTADNEPRSVAQFLLSANLHIENNVLWCERHALVMEGAILHALATQVVGNEIAGSRQGAIRMLGLSAPGSSTRINANSLNVNGEGIAATLGGLWIEGNKLVSTPGRVERQALDDGITLQIGLDRSGSDLCQILANQVSGFSGAAIALRAPVRDAIIKQNVVERCGNGIVAEEATYSSVSIENNHVSDIGDANDEGKNFVVGIGVRNAGAATVRGNTVRRVGQDTARAPLRAGISAANVQRIGIGNNDISEIAPLDNYAGVAAGITVRAPYTQADISLNTVNRDFELAPRDSRAQWYAVLVDDRSGERRADRIGSYATIRIDDTRMLVFGARRPYLVNLATDVDVTGAVIVKRASTSVLGNALTARGITPTVQIETVGDCLFNNNCCELHGRSSATVRIDSAATVVSSNRVKGGEVSLQLPGDPRRKTVLGNVTTGAIVPQLSSPWDALNLVG